MEFLEVGKLYFNPPMVNIKFKLLTRGLNFFFFNSTIKFYSPAHGFNVL